MIEIQPIPMYSVTRSLREVSTRERGSPTVSRVSATPPSAMSQTATSEKIRSGPSSTFTQIGVYVPAITRYMLEWSTVLSTRCVFLLQVPIWYIELTTYSSMVVSPKMSIDTILGVSSTLSQQSRMVISTAPNAAPACIQPRNSGFMIAVSSLASSWFISVSILY